MARAYSLDLHERVAAPALPRTGVHLGPRSLMLAGVTATSLISAVAPLAQAWIGRSSAAIYAQSISFKSSSSDDPTTRDAANRSRF